MQIYTDEIINYEEVECVDCGRWTLTAAQAYEDKRCTECSAAEYDYRDHGFFSLKGHYETNQ